jgi:hypothetical protein
MTREVVAGSRRPCRSVAGGYWIPFKQGNIARMELRTIVAVHRISLFGALLIIVVALLLLFVIGPLGLLVLILAGVLLWYAFGPGRLVVTNSG